MADSKSQPKKGLLIVMMPRTPRVGGTRIPRVPAATPRVPRVSTGLPRLGAGGKAPTTSKRGGSNGKPKK